MFLSFDAIEKRRADKLKEAELLAAKSEICKLQMQISSVETSRKRARVDFEQEKESIHQGFMVRNLSSTLSSRKFRPP